LENEEDVKREGSLKRGLNPLIDETLTLSTSQTLSNLREEGSDDNEITEIERINPSPGSGTFGERPALGWISTSALQKRHKGATTDDITEIGRVSSSPGSGTFRRRRALGWIISGRQNSDMGVISDDITEIYSSYPGSDVSGTKQILDGNRMGSNLTPQRIRPLFVRNDSQERRSVQMMRLNTKIILILDESHSMMRRRQEVINGYNDFLRKQKTLLPVQGEETTFSLLKFHRLCTPVIYPTPIANVPELSPDQYMPQNSTSLYDAMGMGMEWGDNYMGRVLLVIITDGAENTSLIYRKQQIKSMIDDRISRGNWTFAYIGFNPTVFAQELGIPLKNATDFTPNSVPQMFRRLSRSTSRFRSTDSVASTSNFISP
jgi:hypothetical protein